MLSSATAMRTLRNCVLALTFALIGVARASAAEVAAASCSLAHVSTAVAAANSGDVVTIPAGECTWTGQLAITEEIVLRGAGAASTIITNTYAGGYDGMIQFTVAADTAAGLGIQNISFLNAVGHSSWLIEILGVDTHVVIKDCAFTGDGDGVAIYKIGRSYGVIADCTFVDYQEFLQLYGDGAAGWTRDAPAGTANNFFVEDCTFTRPTFNAAHAVVGWEGSETVFRHNMLTNLDIDFHGKCFAGPLDDRSARWYEVYSNTVTATEANQADVLNARGGTGLVYDNIITTSGDGSFVNTLVLRHYRIRTSGCAAELGCCENVEGYPCHDQIGRGKNQALEPTYLWNNTGGSVSVVDTGADCAYTSANYIALGRDYYASAMPGYTPYTYPHPLRNAATVTLGTGGAVTLGTGGAVTLQ